MAAIQAKAVVFGRGSNVLDYWLAHAQGFEVDSGRRNRERVESVVVESDGRATTLVVHSSLRRRRRLLPAEAFAAVDPFARALHLECERRQSESTCTRIAAALAPATAQTRKTLAPLALGVAVRLGVALAWSWRRLRRAARGAARQGNELIAGTGVAIGWLRPRARSSAGVACVTVAALGVAIVAAGRCLCTRLLGWARLPARQVRPARSRRFGASAQVDPRRRRRTRAV